MNSVLKTMNLNSNGQDGAPWDFSIDWNDDEVRQYYS